MFWCSWCPAECCLWRRRHFTRTARRAQRTAHDAVSLYSLAVALTPQSSETSTVDPAPASSSSSHKAVDPSALFNIERKVGQGSFGSVYKAVQHESGTTVALKIIDMTGSTESIQKINKEVRSFFQFGETNRSHAAGQIVLMSKLHSSLIVDYLGSYRHQQQLWIALEFMDAGSCADTMRQLRRALPVAAVARVCGQAAAGVAYLHEAGVIHRDIKAANLLLNSAGAVKLADFGVSATVSGALAARGTQVGSPFWMAPETIEARAYGPPVDVWALGVTAVELAEGAPPLAAEGPVRALFLIANEAPRGLTTPERWSSELNAFVADAMQKEPGSRPTAAALAVRVYCVASVVHEPKTATRVCARRHRRGACGATG